MSPSRVREPGALFRALFAVLFGVLVLARAGTARADCVSPAYGVPGLPGGPVWVGTGARTGLDDPRWAGATRFYFPSHPVMTPPSSTVRTIVDGNTLIVSYQILADASASGQDTIWLGVGKNATKAGAAAGDDDNFLVELSLGTITAGDAQSFTLADEHVWSSVDGNPANWVEQLNPPYMDKTVARYWTGGSVVWAVNLRFDLSVAGIDATTRDAKVFFASFMETGFGLGWVDQFPLGAVFVDTSTASMDFSQANIDPDNFGAFNIGSYGTPCADGISLGYMQIGASPPPDNIINGPGGADATANTFFAHPDWHSVPIVANAVQAKFRIANWGSMIADPAAPWDLAIASALNDAAGHLEQTCAVGSGVCGGVLGASHDPHQCMLVELSKGTASTVDPLKFANDSVYRNMDFDAASTLKREAEISVKGLQALPNTTLRDTYILVRTVNMPAPTDKPLFLPRDAMSRAVELAQHPPERPQPKQNPPGELQKVKGNAAAAPPPARPKATAKAKAELPPPLDPDLAKDGFEHMTSAWPTYQVFVFHDTGQFIIVRGKKYRRLEQQVPFGYFINHNGPYFGFDHSIEGLNGANLVALAPDFYKLAIPNNGTAKIVTTITALEKPGGGGPGGCKDCCAPAKVEIKPHCYCALPGVSGGGNSALVSALGALGVFLARRRARRPPS